jgi:hypothetical protein
MIEQELNKGGHRVWTTYAHMDDHFIPSFVSIMNSTQYLIVCLSDMYRLNNRCRNELLYATTDDYQVLSWKVRAPTNNPNEDEKIRIRAIETLLNRIALDNIEKIPPADVEYVNIQMEKRPSNRRRRTREMMNLENWTNPEVIAWCQTIDLPGFLKLITAFDGPSVIKLYEFCKPNSPETVSLLNNDLHNVCKQENIPDIQISVPEFIRFQTEVEKILPTSALENSSTSSSRLDIKEKRSKIKICSIL